MRRRQRGLPGPFQQVAALVERAKAALIAAVPGPRRDPEPLAVSIVAFDEALAEARARLEAWTEARPEDVWERCRDDLAEAARRSERLRLEAPDMDFEALVLALGDVIAPLDAFGEAEHELRRRT